MASQTTESPGQPIGGQAIDSLVDSRGKRRIPTRKWLRILEKKLNDENALGWENK